MEGPNQSPILPIASERSKEHRMNGNQKIKTLEEKGKIERNRSSSMDRDG